MLGFTPIARREHKGNKRAYSNFPYTGFGSGSRCRIEQRAVEGVEAHHNNSICCISGSASGAGAKFQLSVESAIRCRRSQWVYPIAREPETVGTSVHPLGQPISHSANKALSCRRSQGRWYSLHQPAFRAQIDIRIKARNSARKPGSVVAR